MKAWLLERKPTSQGQLFSFVKEFRRFGQHSRALHLFDWMAHRGMPLFPGSQAIRLDLLAKAKGIEEAEHYFSSLAPHPKTYGAMLTCYVHSRLEDNSLSLFSRMRHLNFLTATLPYNNLMSLYLSLGQPHKIPDLFCQMQSSAHGISPDSYSYSMLARSYHLMGDAESFDRIVTEVTEHPSSDFKLDWNLHATFAAIYISFGKLDQAESQLKHLEDKMNKTDRNPYHFLITHYAGTVPYSCLLLLLI
jgi:pentatricopeptide repeat protein